MLEPEVHHFSASRRLQEGRQLNGNILAQGRMRIYIKSEGLKVTRHGASREEHAGKLEAPARARNTQEVRTQVSEVPEYCLACHQQFRDQAAGQR